MSNSDDLVRARIEARLLSMLSEMELPPHRLCIETAFAGRSLTLVLRGIGELPPSPSPISHGPRSQCERDILDVLSRSARPLTRSMVLDALASGERIWGESTVSNALAKLTGDGLLKNSRKLGGYFIPVPK